MLSIIIRIFFIASLIFVPVVSEGNVDIRVLDDGVSTSIEVSGSMNTNGMQFLATKTVTPSAGIGVGIIPTTVTSVAGIYRTGSNTSGNVYSGLLSTDTTLVTNSSVTQGATYATGRGDAGGGFGIDNQYVYLSANYVSGSPIGYTLNFVGKSAADVGFPHTNKLWSIGGNSISLYVQNIPGVISVSPASGVLSGGSLITISGHHFTGATSVTVGGSSCSNLSVQSDTLITCASPSGTAGPASVVVTTPEGTNPSNTLFTYSNSQSISPFRVLSSSNSVATGGTVTLTPSGGGGTGDIIYRVVSGNCSIRGNVVTSTSSGSCVVMATKISDGDYSAVNAENIVISFVGSVPSMSFWAQNVLLLSITLLMIWNHKRSLT